jgi:hypothetical protein
VVDSEWRVRMAGLARWRRSLSAVVVGSPGCGRRPVWTSNLAVPRPRDQPRPRPATGGRRFGRREGPYRRGVAGHRRLFREGMSVRELAPSFHKSRRRSAGRWRTRVRGRTGRLGLAASRPRHGCRWPRSSCAYVQPVGTTTGGSSTNPGRGTPVRTPNRGLGGAPTPRLCGKRC